MPPGIPEAKGERTYEQRRQRQVVHLSIVPEPDSIIYWVVPAAGQDAKLDESVKCHSWPYSPSPVNRLEHFAKLV